MKRTAALVLACLLAAAGAASAQDDDKTVDVQHWGGRPIRKPRLPVVSTTRFVATLRGVTSANALMSLTLDTVAQTASYTLAMNDVPGYTMSHIHVGAATVSGPPVVLLLPGLDTAQSNVVTTLPALAPIDICTMTYSSRFSAAQLIIFNGAGLTWDEFVGNLRNGTLYANIYTATAPTGLIRGQLLPLQQKGAHGGVWTSTYGGVWKGYSNHCNVPITWAP